MHVPSFNVGLNFFLSQNSTGAKTKTLTKLKFSIKLGIYMLHNYKTSTFLNNLSDI